MNPMEHGVALLRAGRFHEAVLQFGAALRESPLAVEPRLGLSQACIGLGDGWAATAWLSDACRAAPQRPDLWRELARVLAAQQRDAELGPLLQAALSLHPDDPPLLHARADLYLRGHDYAQSLPNYVRLYELQPRDRVVLLHLGYCLEQVGDVEGAATRYREAIALEPDFLEAHIDLAGVLWRLEDFGGALAHAQKAVALAPGHAHAQRILGTALLNLNRLDDAEGHLRRALELRPEFELAELDLAFAHLLRGELREGWALYARRWRDAQRLQRPAFYDPAREWEGPAAQPLAGKRVAVYAEQGLGDAVQFSRYLPWLQRQGATVVASVQPALAALIEHSFEGVQCLTEQRRFEVDCHVALMDLPLHHGTTLETLPADVPYLRTTMEKKEAWRERLALWDGRLKVGLAWAGSRAQVNNNNRSMRLSNFSVLFEMAGVQCFSLQQGDAGRFTDIKVATERLVDLTREWADFTDSAAMLDALDLVITVDTAIAHLAGAMAKPVWVMLAPNADWRWMLEREDSPWYPTMRLFRRGVGEERAAQVARIAQALGDRLHKPGRLAL
ncbi:MAG: tetratricopeptide repeat protein [Ramlibacter sp.]